VQIRLEEGKSPRKGVVLMKEILDIPSHLLTRRKLFWLASVGAPAARWAPGTVFGTSGNRVAAQDVELVIDLSSEPSTLDPATTYDANGWSIVHSIYDSLVQYGPAGVLEPLLAESFEQSDPMTFTVTLRPGITFHNGEALTSKAVAFSVEHILAEETASQVAANFGVISDVKEIDDLTFQLLLTQPAPWLPAQIAAWLAVLPPEYAATEEFQKRPVGTGPYQFVEWSAGERISMEANGQYFPDSPKGQPVAAAVAYRFVEDATTRVADVLSGTAKIVQAVPTDQIEAIEAEGDEVLRQPIAGCAFIRIPTDIEPFTDPRVRLALNHAVDVDSIIRALLDGDGQRLPNVFVPSGLGYDASLKPHTYDPDLAKSLLTQAGYPDGFDSSIDLAVTERVDIVQAVAGQLEQIGVHVNVAPLELAVFNAPDLWQGTNSDAAPLRFVSWRPLFDPYTLLNLVFSKDGFLSRHDNPKIQPLIDSFASEADQQLRAKIGKDLGKALFEEPAAIYLFSLTSRYGVNADAPAWTPREDEYMIPTLRS
jgi:peptide/nickel transport system substrate-binding protein